jgi:probable F420-dependent oxidoreductase
MSATVIEAFGQAAGPVGAFLPVMPGVVSADTQREAVLRLESAGYRSAWSNEVIGKDAFVQLGILLAATQRMTFGTCIANIWARPAQTTAGAAAQLADAYPGRFVLGLGVGYVPQAESVGRDFGKPLATVTSYVTAMGPDTSYPRLLGAMGPKMLALAGEVTDGALPAGVAPDFTADARGVLGGDKLLVVYVDASSSTADVPDLAKAHLAAGADHVILGTALGADFADHIDRLVALAPALTALR